MIRIFTDAAVSGQYSYAGIGILIIANDEQEQLKIPLKGKDWNNHQAEFEAIIHALSHLINQNKYNQMVFCYTDSQIVAESIEKNYAKNKNFQEYLNKIKSLMKHFKYINIEWIPQNENKGADNLARQALQLSRENKE